ncbi:MAG: hypothetical protein HQL99_08335 [Magnetococcales bacterium]|nr:hypothetical protein [Magnetococcales bacterium]
MHKQITKRMSLSTILDILRVRVFPHISRGEIVRITLQVRIHHDRIEGILQPHDH